MAYDARQNKMRRQDAVGMEDLVNQFIREMKLSSGLDKVHAAAAWNAVSGAEAYTLEVRLDRGVMTCTLSSSVVRNQLYFQLNALTQRLNEYLSKDPLFAQQGTGLIVKKLILK